MGLSFFINDLEGKIDTRRNISHVGGLVGHQALMVALPDDGLAIVVMINSNSEIIYQLADDILAAAYHVKTGEALAKVISLSQKQMDAYIGYYVTPCFMQLPWSH